MKSDNKKYTELGQQIAEARIAAGFSIQADLAQALSCTQQTVSKWEAGTSRPKAGQMSKLAEILNLKPNILLELAGYITPSAFSVSFCQPFPVDKLEPEFFERFVADLLEFIYGHEEATIRKAGSSGHTQDGLDIRVEFKDKIYSYQCKRTQQFGPADVESAVKAHKASAQKKFLVLSRTASPQTAAAIKNFPGWELWDKEYLSQLIRTRLSIDAQNRMVDIYFRGQRLNLLGRNEPGPWQTVEEFFTPLLIGSSYFTHQWKIMGRVSELDGLKTLLQQPKTPLVLLTGAAGMGKSKVLIETLFSFQESHPQILVRMLSPTGDATRESLENLGDGPKILVVDDAHDRDGLSNLLHFSAIPDNQTRLVFSTRPYAKLRIKGEAAILGIENIPEIILGPLKVEDLTALASEALAEQDVSSSIAEEIVEVSGDNPLVTVMIAQIVAKEKIPFELAKNKDTIRELILGKFQKMIVGGLGSPNDAQNIKHVLNILAAVQPFHIEDPAILKLLLTVNGLSHNDSTKILRLLLDSGIIYQRGNQFRLMPDLLGDYLLEECCKGLGNKLSPLAIQLFEHVQYSQLENFLVNLGRMDWRLAGGEPTNSHLLDEIWIKFRDIVDPFDPRLSAIQAVALYQPQQALEFVENRIRLGIRLPEFCKVLRGIAYHFNYLEQVCAALWELGREKPPQDRYYWENPIKTLKELASFEANKPLDFIKKVYEFGIQLTNAPKSWNSINSPLEILEPILSVEGFSSRSKSLSIILSPHYTNPQAVKPLREGVIQKILELMQHSDIKIAQNATSYVSQALRFPLGILDSTAPKEHYRYYEQEFTQTLTLLKELSANGKFSPVVQISLAEEITWHTYYASDRLQEAAKEVLKTYPSTLEFRLMAALARGLEHEHENPSDADRWSERNEKRLASLSKELKLHFSTEDLHDNIEQALETLHGSGFKPNTAYMLINQLLKNDIALAKTFLNTARIRPFSPIALFCSNAIDVIFNLTPLEGKTIIDQCLRSSNIEMARAASYTLDSLCRQPDKDNILLLEMALTSSDARIVNNAIHALRTLDNDTPLLVIELAKKVRLETNYKFAQELFVLFRKNETLFNALTETDVTHFLNSLKYVPKLEGHWIEEFIALLSEHYPMQLIDFISFRLMHATETKSYEFRPINYGPYSHVPLAFHATPQFQPVGNKFWNWLLDNLTSPEPFLFHIIKVVGAIFSGINGNEAFVSFIEPKLETATREEIELIGELIINFEQDFIFSHKTFVVHLLERSQEIDKVLLNRIIRDLHSSAVTGSRSGILGEPFPEDIRQKERAELLLTQIPRFSPAYELYLGVLESIEYSIEKCLKEAEALKYY